MWTDYEDPAKESPMSARVFNILEVYIRLYKETGKEQPFLKNARYWPSTHQDTNSLTIVASSL